MHPPRDDMAIHPPIGDENAWHDTPLSTTERLLLHFAHRIYRIL